MLEHDLAALSDSEKDQYFLTNPDKLRFILDAARIRETDSVVELGAGAGTVARALPRCASLTLIELDERLIPVLQSNSPAYATVLNADGVKLISAGQVSADVILANLPNSVTTRLIAMLPTLQFRIAILAVGSTEPFEHLPDSLEYSVLTAIGGSDFVPSQPGESYLVAVNRRIPDLDKIT